MRPRPLTVMIDHLLQIHILHQPGNGNDPLVIGLCQGTEFLRRHHLHRYLVLPRQFPDLRYGVARYIPLKEDLIHGAPRPDRFDQRLPPDYQMTFLHVLNFNCPLTNSSLIFKIPATDIESVISPRSTIS